MNKHIHQPFFYLINPCFVKTNQESRTIPFFNNGYIQSKFSCLEFLNFVILLPKLKVMKYSIKILIVLLTIHCSLFTIHCEAQVTQLWGMTFAGGGPDSSGTIFRIFTDGS